MENVKTIENSNVINVAFGGVKEENQYTMDDRVKVADRAARDIEEYLNSLDYTLSVVNVENDTYYRKEDVDLIWTYRVNGKEVVKRVEIKGDTYSQSKNFFIETISNMTKNTPGCFLYTQSNYIFYYFVEKKELTILQMDKFKPWFMKNQERFEKRNLSTKAGNGSYRSEGRLVPKEILWRELNAKHFTLDEDVDVA